MSFRTDYCGALRLSDVDRKVTICGWVARRREHGEHLAFVDLRDHTGIVQCVVDNAHDLRSEHVLRITGIVSPRLDGTVNEGLGTGEIELKECVVETLSVAEPPPFPLDRTESVDENTRIRYRYVDLRTERMQRNLRLRAKVNSTIRRSMEEQGFLEVETPSLIASTPEGARDFVVPARQRPGTFYALPQSPQMFKQLCMVGGIDRYYQIARCFRDEDLRADRQFEFSQLDMEAAFVTEDEILDYVSVAISAVAKEISGIDVGEISRMTWLEAAERYGSDKPDTRFGMELVELTDLFSETDFKVFQSPCIKGIRVPGGAELGRNKLDALTEKVKGWGAKGLVWLKVAENGEITSPVAKFMSEAEVSGLLERLEAKPGDICYLVADDRRTTRHILGLLRLDQGRPAASPNDLNFLWITDFPLFEALSPSGDPIPAHHPFTMPHEQDMDLLNGEGEELLQIRSQAYDLTLNGWELGSGSVRIHRRDIQSRIFELLGISEEDAQRKFGFLLDAFRYGAPPHAGFAFGIDRLTALLCGEDNIREVIAFPKTQSGADPLTGAPTAIDKAHLDELGLRVLPPSN